MRLGNMTILNERRDFTKEQVMHKESGWISGISFLSQDTQPHTAVGNTSSPTCGKSESTQPISPFIDKGENILRGDGLCLHHEQTP